MEKTTKEEACRFFDENHKEPKDTLEDLVWDLKFSFLRESRTRFMNNLRKIIKVLRVKQNYFEQILFDLLQKDGHKLRRCSVSTWLSRPIEVPAKYIPLILKTIQIIADEKSFFIENESIFSLTIEDRQRAKNTSFIDVDLLQDGQVVIFFSEDLGNNPRFRDWLDIVLAADGFRREIKK